MIETADLDVLKCVPRRLGRWRAGDDGRIVVERPKPKVGGVRGVLARIEWFMSYPRIRLDEIGSLVWQAMDGSAPLQVIAEELSASRSDVADADERVALFATALQRQGLVELLRPAK